MREHFPHEIAVDPIGGEGIPHIREHGLQDLVDPMLIDAEILPRIAEFIAAGFDLPHVFDASGLLGDDTGGNILQIDAGRIPEDIVPHIDSGLMVRDHLYDKVMGNTVGQFRLSHSPDHVV